MDCLAAIPSTASLIRRANLNSWTWAPSSSRTRRCGRRRWVRAVSSESFNAVENFGGSKSLADFELGAGKDDGVSGANSPWTALNRQLHECELSGQCPPASNEEFDGVEALRAHERSPEEAKEGRVAAAWAHWNKLGAPRFLLAPMVDQSELPFRLLCRKYGATAAYTPMLHARVFVDDKNYRAVEFSTCEADRPLLVQFCANDPDTLLQAAELVQSRCDYVDLNLGCPQRVARRGRYGAFLMDHLHVVESLVSKLASSLSVPVSCKIRIFPEIEATVEYVKMLEGAGCSLLAVHGRTREQKCREFELADWDSIRAVKEAVRIPVLANGNIRWMEDVDACLSSTGADGVLSAKSLLENPALFAGYRTAEEGGSPGAKLIDERVLCLEYIDLVERYPVPLRMVLRHVFSLLKNFWFQIHVDLRDELHDNQYRLSLEYLRDFVHRLIARGPPAYSLYGGESSVSSLSLPTLPKLAPVDVSKASTAASPYVLDSVRKSRLMRLMRRRPGMKLKLPSEWTDELTRRTEKLEI